MFINKEEMRSVIYSYQMDEITEHDDTIILMAISSAINEVRSYLTPSNQRQWSDGRTRYDADAVFAQRGEARDALIVELCKDIALYRICRLSNADIIYDHVRERYNNATDYLTKVADGKITLHLPTLEADSGVLQAEDNRAKPFRYGSRHKFIHE